jgi:hypothetical protein
VESFIKELLGPQNSVVDYLAVLAVYGALFLVMRHANARIELNFRKSFWILSLDWLESDGRTLPAALSNRAQDRFTVCEGSRFGLDEPFRASEWD